MRLGMAEYLPLDICNTVMPKHVTLRLRVNECKGSPGNAHSQESENHRDERDCTGFQPLVQNLRRRQGSQHTTAKYPNRTHKRGNHGTGREYDIVRWGDFEGISKKSIRPRRKLTHRGIE